MTKKLSILCLLLFFQIPVGKAQAFLSLPIEGIATKDYHIVNYVDWDTVGYRDHMCGTKSYDGHQGTDFVIRSFAQMDSGVNVKAATSGRVTFVQDGAFDRETGGDVAKRLGNYIGIRHSNAYYTYYGHLKKNSIAVSVGDSVNSGDIIGQVGSSGNSTDPHLHFELWYDSLYVVDPFRGACGNSNALFLNVPEYDTSLRIIESGLISKSDLELDDLRERFTTHFTPYFLPSNSDDIDTTVFEVASSGVPTPNSNADLCHVLRNTPLKDLLNLENYEIHISDIRGSEIEIDRVSSLPSAWYLLRLRENEEFCIVKKWID